MLQIEKSGTQEEFDEGIAKVKLMGVNTASDFAKLHRFSVWDVTQHFRPSGSVNRLRGPKPSDLGYFQETVRRNGILWVVVPLL